MNQFTSDLYERMNSELVKTASAENELQRAERSYEVIRSALAELRTFILEYQFKDKQEEIQFFKEIKPKFLRQLIYSAEVYQVEANRSVGDKEAQLAYYRHMMEPVQVFFERNQFLYVYYRTGKTNYDELFFLRDAEIAPIAADHLPDMDGRFSTPYSFLLAKLQAYELLNNHIVSAMNVLNGIPAKSGLPDNFTPKDKWTDPKVYLIELALGIYAKGSVNNGNATLKDIIKDMEYIFNIDLGNFYGAIDQNIRIRKKKRTVYLYQLIDCAERDMDEQDQNPRASS